MENVSHRDKKNYYVELIRKCQNTYFWYLQSNLSNGYVEYRDVLFGTVLPIPYFVTKEKKGVVTLVLKGVASGIIYYKTQSKCMKTNLYGIF